MYGGEINSSGHRRLKTGLEFQFRSLVRTESTIDHLSPPKWFALNKDEFALAFIISNPVQLIKMTEDMMSL